MEKQKNSINNKFLFSPLSKVQVEIKDSLPFKPVIYPPNLCREKQILLGRKGEVFRPFIDSGLLKKFKVGSAKNKIVYLCESTFEAWDKLDQLIFSDKNTLH